MRKFDFAMLALVGLAAFASVGTRQKKVDAIRKPQVTLSPTIKFPKVAGSFVDCPQPGVMEVHAKFDLDNKPGGRQHIYIPYLLVRRYARGPRSSRKSGSRNTNPRRSRSSRACT